MPVRLILSSVVILGVAACAQVAARKDDGVTTTAGPPRYPACDAEIGAFMALSKIAKQLGDDWRVYEPALQALQDQILDCVGDNYPDPLPI